MVISPLFLMVKNWGKPSPFPSETAARGASAARGAFSTLAASNRISGNKQLGDAANKEKAAEAANKLY